MLRIPLLLLALLPACQGDETLTAYGAAGKVWGLESVDGVPWATRTTLEFPEPGQLAGEAHCNRYFGTLTAPYPWFETGPLGATKRACPELEAENRYFQLLGQMTLSEVSGDILVLSNDAGREMVFRAN